MSESEHEETGDEYESRTGQLHACRRCGQQQGLVGKYEIWLCRQCFCEIARDMGFKKYS